MKIAVCVSGQMRTVERTIRNIKEFFNVKHYQIDFFVHTWDINSQPAIFQGVMPDEFKSTVPYKKIHDHVKLFNPVNYEIQNYRRFRYVHGIRHSNGASMFPLFYTWLRSINLMREVEKEKGKYDLCIKIRPDIIFVPGETIEQYVKLFFDTEDPNLTFIANRSWHTRENDYTLDDIIFMSLPNVAFDISKNWWEKYSKYDVHPEVKGMNIHTQFVYYLKNLGYNPYGFNDLGNNKVLDTAIIRPEAPYNTGTIDDFYKCKEFDYIFYGGDNSILNNREYTTDMDLYRCALSIKEKRGFIQKDVLKILKEKYANSNVL